MSEGQESGTYPSSAGYARVNGLDLYYEIHGTGQPLVLLHGGLLTIDLTFGGILPALAATRQVVAVELQGHGHTGDIDRDPTLAYLADDVVGLLDHLGIGRADFFGFSLGGLTALQLALTRPARVDRLVLASTHYRPDGYHPEVLDPRARAGSRRMPTESDFQEMYEAYAKVAPDPGRFEAFAEKLQPTVHAFEGWPARALAGLEAPVLLLVGDTDFVRLEHAVEMHELIPGSQLGVLPGTTHSDLPRRADLVVPLVRAFLRPPADASPAGTGAGSDDR
ncbi:alpha/beta fold hydrolase [Streptomyces monomycini]|uniref:alpha/beta fold hydrolase n=1 Tax=Streptomyces monomycini TaxID=371720 RepID=UPI0004AAF5E3|nr:alpha/beta hydrolase [Streptomyces monomycini]